AGTPRSSRRFGASFSDSDPGHTVGGGPSRLESAACGAPGRSSGGGLDVGTGPRGGNGAGGRPRPPAPGEGGSLLRGVARPRDGRLWMAVKPGGAGPNAP